jgi:RNA polymerase sigma-70 factor (ECF subfamily)
MESSADAVEGTLWRERFDLLYRSNFSAVYGYVARRLYGYPGVVDDVVAEVFAVAWSKVAELPDPPQDRRWFLATSRFAVLREKRRLQRRMVEIPMDLPDGLPPSSPPGGAIVTDAAVEAGFLREVLDRLPERDAEVLRLLYWDDVSCETAAGVLGCSANAVSVRAHRAKKRLQKELARLDGPDRVGRGGPQPRKRAG